VPSAEPCHLVRDEVDLQELLEEHQRITGKGRVFELSLDPIAHSIENNLARFFAF
jgi:hypothetical protein